MGGEADMWMWIVVASASQPVVVNGQTHIPFAIKAEAIIQTPTGDIMIGTDDFNGNPVRETIDAQDFVVREPLGFSPRGTFAHSWTGCDIDGDGTQELPDFHTNGSGRTAIDFRDVYTGASVRLLDRWNSGPDQVVTFVACEDIDADGQLEYLANTITWPAWPASPSDQRMVVWEDDGSLLHVESIPVDARDGHAVMQLDGDPALEVVLGDNRIFDGATWTVQGTRPSAQSTLPFDVDGDGMDEWVSWDGQTLELWGMSGRWWAFDPPNDLMSVFLGDANGDGLAEITLADSTGSQFSNRISLDAITAAPNGPPTHGRYCPVWWPFDSDGDGAYELRCDDLFGSHHSGVDPSTGLWRHFKGQGAAYQPAFGDLDGDGTTEVIWSDYHGDRIVVRDAQGNWLDMVPFDEWGVASVHDLDGDGDMEITHGLQVFDYSPTTGLVALAPLAISVVDRVCVRDTADTNSDGYVELLLEDCFTGIPSTVDFATGATGFFPVIAGNGHSRYADLDQDGTTEIVMGLRSGDLAVFDTQGNELDRVPALEWDVVEHQGNRFILTAQPTRNDHINVYVWTGRRLRGIRQLTAPAAPFDLSYLNGRIWYNNAQALHGWSPFNGTVETHDLSVYSESIGAADGMIWMGGQAEIVGIPAP